MRRETGREPGQRLGRDRAGARPVAPALPPPQPRGPRQPEQHRRMVHQGQSGEEGARAGAAEEALPPALGEVEQERGEEGMERASDLCAYTREEVERVARVAFRLARGRRGKVTSVDKANVLATGRLWRAAVSTLHSKEFPDVELEHALVDSTAMKLIQNPAAFDVVLTENMFGDILSDEASVLGGSIGLAPSASLGVGKVGLYEPIHGSAPDIAGQDVANPSGSILSLAMMLRESVGHEAAARAMEQAIETAVGAGARTRDLGGTTACSAFAADIALRVAKA